MPIRIYRCPLETGWIRYDVSIDDKSGRVHVQEQCINALEAYKRVQHFDQQGAKIEVDSNVGVSLDKLRDQYRDWLKGE